MPTLGHQKVDSLTLMVVAGLLAGATALTLLAPALLPWPFVVLAALAAILYTAARWEITLWAWLWVLSYGLAEAPQIRLTITGFFNTTGPRFIFLAALLAFSLHFIIRNPQGMSLNRGLLWAMLLLAAVCGISAQATGWVAKTEGEVHAAPYFRFIEGMLFAFAMFVLVYNSVRRPEQVPIALLALSVYTWYALYVGYVQYAALRGAEGLRAILWPTYINDPSYGIHFDRARGAFGSAGQQAILLVLTFYGNLLLLRRLRGGYRAALILQTILIPPAIFFTGVRSAFLAFLLCGILWCLLASRNRLGGIKLAMAGLVLLVLTAVFWGRLSQENRQTGGVGDTGPVVARAVLVQQTWQMFKQHPLTGVGFGKFSDAQVELRRDPTSISGMSAGVLVEHNMFLNLLAETGLIGLLAQVLVVVLVFRESVQLYRRLPPAADSWLDRTFVVLFWIALVNYLTDAMFRDTYWDAFATGLFWSFAALAVGYNRLAEVGLMRKRPSLA